MEGSIFGSVVEEPIQRRMGKMIQRVGIIGFGALGVKYALEFQNTLGMENVLVIADRERIERYRRDGMYVNDRKQEFQYVADEEAQTVDLLVFATKYTGLEAAMKSAGRALGEHTIVLSVLNGVTSEQVIEKRLHPGHLLYCTVQGMDATKEGNRLWYQKSGSIAFGSRDNVKNQDVQDLEELLIRCHMAYQIPEDIHHQLWSKWMLNVGVNQVCAVYKIGYGGIQEGGPYRDIMLAAMQEARSVAQAEGISLSVEELEAWAGLMDTLDPNGEPSMRQDTKAGRKTEVELFAGVVCRLGRKHGIKTPWNDRFYQELCPYQQS